MLDAKDKKKRVEKKKNKLGSVWPGLGMFLVQGDEREGHGLYRRWRYCSKKKVPAETQIDSTDGSLWIPLTRVSPSPKDDGPNPSIWLMPRYFLMEGTRASGRKSLCRLMRIK